METASTVILDALQLLLVQADEAEIEASEAQSAIRFLNRMMSRLDADGITLGYTEVSSLGDNITVPDGALEGLVTNLAVVLGPLFLAPGETVPVDVRVSAVEGLKAMRRLATTLPDAQYPCRLPRGSGNTSHYIDSDNFYTCNDDQLITEISRDIIAEDDTI